MHDIDAHLARHGGLAATHELHRLGWTKRQLRTAVLSGMLVRVRQGWYCLPRTDTPLQEAARVGGHLTCRSGARALGLWVRAPHRLDVAVSPNAARLRTRNDKTVRLVDRPDATVHVHWTRRPQQQRLLADALQCLADLAHCESPEWVVAAADSAIRAGLVTRDQWLAATARMPAKLASLLERVEERSESITESLVRFRLAMLGIECRVQVRIPGVGRVDLLIGDHLVIELDGWEFHRDREAFEEDRRRDTALASRGYLVLRFTYRQVTREWSRVVAALRAYL